MRLDPIVILLWSCPLPYSNANLRKPGAAVEHVDDWVVATDTVYQFVYTQEYLSTIHYSICQNMSNISGLIKF